MQFDSHSDDSLSDDESVGECVGMSFCRFLDGGGGCWAAETAVGAAAAGGNIHLLAAMTWSLDRSSSRTGVPMSDLLM